MSRVRANRENCPDNGAAQFDKQVGCPDWVWKKADAPRCRPHGVACRPPIDKSPEPRIPFAELRRLGHASLLGDGNELDLEVYKVLIRIECNGPRPSPFLFSRQVNITPRMRATIIDWVIDTSRKYGMHDETLHGAVCLMDTYLTEMMVDKAHYQRLACAALMIAAKAEETRAPRLEDLVYIAGGSFTRSALELMEAAVFKAIRQVSPVTSLPFLCRALRMVEADRQLRGYCLFLLDTLLLADDFIGARPSFIAAVVLYVGLAVVRGPGQWTQDIGTTTGYQESAVKQGATSAVQAARRITTAGYKAVENKYKPEVGNLSLVNFPRSFT